MGEELRGMVALVTGASQGGTGRAVATRFGAKVYAPVDALDAGSA